MLHRRRLGTRLGIGRFALAIAGAALLGAATPAGAVTYDVHFRAYCGSASPTCGFGSFEAYEERVLAAVQEMNLVWKPAGISFRPTVFPIEVEDHFSETQGCAELPDDSPLRARRQEWRANVAAANPQAISFLITEGPNRCCTDPPDLPYDPPPNGDTATGLYGLLCDARQGGDSGITGRVWAHEMGHYFCLRHTMTFVDRSILAPDLTPDNDLDDAFQVFDTPTDPGPFEDDDTAVTEPTLGDLLLAKEACQALRVEDVDDGSPHPARCSVTCAYRDFTSLDFTSFSPHTRNAMSYYDPGSCTGPYVWGGTRFEAFTDDQVQEIADCRAIVPQRVNLPDVCASRGGDFDHDGICQFDDDCPFLPNTAQTDEDGDGQADACDNCPGVAAPQTDTDGDGLGDACDPDLDDDGCPNATDQHPNEGAVVVGSKFAQNCGTGTEPAYGFEGSDPDADGFLSCEDRDDDDDGICDGASAIPGGAANPDVPARGCSAGPDMCPFEAGIGCALQGAPSDCAPAWAVCLGGGCVEFFLKLVSVINPADSVVIDSFTILNRTIFASPIAGATLSETVKTLEGSTAIGGFAAGAAPAAAASAGPNAAAGPTLRLEIWSRTTNQLAAVVAEWDPSQVLTREGVVGRVVSIEPTRNPLNGALRIDLDTRWAAAGPSDGANPDADGDGVPDWADDCVSDANPGQRDADGDGFGDACDADRDGDGRVTILDCRDLPRTTRVPLRPLWKMGEPSDAERLGDLGGTGAAPPDLAPFVLAKQLANADLDGDDDADAVDARLCDDALGDAPGPSGFALPIAFLDADKDGIGDSADNCPHAANPDQADRGGVGSGAPPDGIGDACQCGDVNGSGAVTLTDAVVLARSLLVPPAAVVARPELCDVGGAAGCTLADALTIRRALLAPATAGIQPQCAAAGP